MPKEFTIEIEWMGEAPAHSTMMHDTECMIPDENIRKWFFNHEGHEEHEEKEWDGSA